MENSAAVAERLHDQRSRDLTPHLAQARADIHEALMEEGCWPPSPGVGKSWHVELDIPSFVNTLPGWEQDEFIRGLWSGGEAADALKERFSDRIKEWIPAGMVEDRAATVEAESREQAETDADWEREYGAGVTA